MDLEFQLLTLEKKIKKKWAQILKNRNFSKILLILTMTEVFRDNRLRDTTKALR